jgi:hypothetical protein
MNEIAEMTREVVERAKRYESDTVPGEFVTLQTPCPKCGGVVKENYKKFACQACDWSTWKIVAGRQFEYDEIETLLRAGKVGPLLGFRNKMGRLFNADIVLNEDKQPTFDFGQPKEGEEAEAVDFSAQEPVGACPKCASRCSSMASPTCARSRSARARLRFPLRQDHPAAADRARADGQAADRGQDRAAQGLRVGAHATQVLRLPGARQGRQGRLRVRGQGAQGTKGTEGWRQGQCSDGHRRGTAPKRAATRKKAS